MNIFGVEVNQSNIVLFFALLTAGCTGGIFFWWKMRRLWFDQQRDFLEHVEARMRAVNAAQTVQFQGQLDHQTAHIEDCIHKTPGHPENPMSKQG
jgi:hypothetical protein